MNEHVDNEHVQIEKSQAPYFFTITFALFIG
jgi:hypothetical protein